MDANKLKILIIEDSFDLLEELGSLLRYENYEVLKASDGDTGIRLAFEHKPDLILCDIVMAGTDGFDVLKKLREKPEFAMTPFIFTTALVEWRVQRKGMELGADDYLVKPFTRITLLNAIKTRLKKAKDNMKQIKQFKSNIIYSLPHEMQTPLNVILGFSKTLKDDSADLSKEEIAEISSYIYDSSVRLSEVIKKFVMLTNVELNKDRKSFSRVAITEKKIRKLAGEIAAKYDRTGDLILEITDIELHIINDWFLFALEELIDNAFKFSEKGGKVTVKSLKDEQNINFIISDNGRGFPPEFCEKIGAFMQFDRKTNEQQGVGLGLFIAKQIVNLHKGEMHIKSSLNFGSDIIMKFPV
jgi:K+-sensing histidine kinase KdpD